MCHAASLARKRSVCSALKSLPLSATGHYSLLGLHFCMSTRLRSPRIPFLQLPARGGDHCLVIVRASSCRAREHSSSPAASPISKPCIESGPRTVFMLSGDHLVSARYHNHTPLAVNNTHPGPDPDFAKHSPQPLSSLSIHTVECTCSWRHLFLSI